MTTDGIAAETINRDADIGPVDYLIVEFPADAQFDGSGLRHLRDVVDKDIIRVLDLVFVRREDDAVEVISVADLRIADDLDLGLFADAATGLIDDEDIAEAGAVLTPGSTALIVVYENHWAAPFASALRRSGAELVASGRIPVDTLIDALDAVESLAD